MNRMWKDLQFYFTDGWEDLLGSSQEINLYAMFSEYQPQEEILEQFEVNAQIFSIMRYTPTANLEFFKEQYRQDQILVFQPLQSRDGKFGFIIYPEDNLELFLRMLNQ